MSTILGNITFGPHRIDSTALPVPTCPYCGAWLHDGLCPRIKAVEYHPDGTVKRLELKD